jgi:hypothetical protein
MDAERFADLWSLMAAPVGLRRGQQFVYKPPNPAAGAGFTQVIGNSWWERIIGVRFTLSTSVAVANRFGQLSVADADGATLLAATLSTAIAASAADTLNGYQGASSQGTIGGNNANAAIPDVILRPGWSFSLTAFNIDVADQLSAISVWVERYPADWASGTLREDRERLVHELLERAVLGG